MSLKTKWIFAVLALGVVIACMKAGDGVGLDKTGGACTADSKDSNCIAYLNPCIANPSGPGCPVDCKKNPSAAGCPVDSCAANPALCAVVHCATTPTAQICIDSCAINSSLSWCTPKVDCNATPTLKVCVDSCTANATLAWCKVDCSVHPSDPSCAAKLKFSDVYPLLVSNTCTSCHKPGELGVTQGKLNMATADSAYANLVGVLVTFQTLAPGWKRVVPTLPDSSMIIVKLAAKTPDAAKMPNGKTYGARMPLNATTAISPSDLATIRQWILDGALK